MRIALIQMNSTEQMEDNLEIATRLINTAMENNPQIVALPELFPILSSERETLKHAQSIHGPIIGRLRTCCIEHNFHLIAGSIPEKTDNPDFFRNTSIVIDNNGNIIAKYSKVHLFDMQIPGQISNFESQFVMPGNEFPLVSVDGWEIGLSICYDLRFPELFRRLALKGAELIFVPSAFAAFTGKDHWEILLRARAIENQVFIAAPAQYGVHQGKVCYGRSMIIDPWGTVLSCASDREAVIFSDIDHDHLLKIRKNSPCLNHIRKDLFPCLEMEGGDSA